MTATLKFNNGNPVILYDGSGSITPAELGLVTLHEQEAALEEMRIRAETAEARIAAVSGVTREQLVANTVEACVRAAVAWMKRAGMGGLARAGIKIAIRARGGK